MAGYNLPESIAGGSTSHIVHHDGIHDIVNKFDKDNVPNNGDVWTYSGADQLYHPQAPSTGVDAEAVRDIIGAALVAGGLVTISVDDTADTITISSSATAAQLRDRATHTGSQAISTVTNLQTSLDGKQDIVRWSGSAWGTRPSGAPFGVIFLSTNDPAATPPPTTGLQVGDVWRRHPDAS